MVSDEVSKIVLSFATLDCPKDNSGKGCGAERDEKLERRIPAHKIQCAE